MTQIQSSNTADNNKDQDKVGSVGYASILFAITRSGFLGMGTFLVFSIAQVDAYISATIGSIVGIIPLLLFLFIVNNKEQKDIIDLNVSLFGKVFGTILNIILNIMVVVMASIILYNISMFLDAQFIPDTSSLYVKILILVAVVYAGSKNIATISRISQCIMFITITMFLVSFLGLMQWNNYDNLMPVLSNGMKSPILAAVFYMIFNTAPIFLMTIITKDKIGEEKHQMRKIVIFYILSNLILIGVIIGTTAVLGYNVVSIYRYPEYMVLKRVTIFTIIERIENTLALQFVFDMFMFMVMAIYFAKQAFFKICKQEKVKKVFPTLLGIVILVLSNFMFENTFQNMKFVKQYYPYILVGGIFVPMIITAIGILVRKIKQNKSSKEAMQEIQIG